MNNNMCKQLFVYWNDFVYLVNVPHLSTEAEAYHFARKSLGVPDEDITPWQEVDFDGKSAKFGNCAKFRYKISV